MGSFRIRDLILTYGFYVVLGIIFVVYSIIAPHFFTLSNMMAILHSAAPLMVTACGIAFVIMMAKIDISLGSIAFFSVGLGIMLVARNEWPLPAGILVIILAGCALGAVNGFCVTVLKINPLILTLGMLFTYRGAALYITDSAIIGVPEALRSFGIASVGPVFLDTIFALVLLFAMHIVQTRTVFGKHVLAIGNDERTAANIGINVRKVKFWGFMLTGLFAALGGLLTICQVGSVNPSIGNGLEFTAIAVIVIGGISLFGGEGRILPGIVLGVLTLAVIENGLNLMGTSPYTYPFVRGSIILIAMYADSLKSRVSQHVQIASIE